MSEIKKLICISCPVGCQLEASQDGEGNWTITGNNCPKGELYGIKEMTAPERVLTTTVRIEGAKLKRLPVRTVKPIPKALIGEAMAVINRVAATAPVHAGEVIIENLLDTGVDLAASRDMLSS